MAGVAILTRCSKTLHVGAFDAEFCDCGKVRQHGDGIITQEVRLSEDPLAILRDLAAKEPIDQGNDYEDSMCALCRAERELAWPKRGDPHPSYAKPIEGGLVSWYPHLPTCPWLRAKTLLDGK